MWFGLDWTGKSWRQIDRYMLGNHVPAPELPEPSLVYALPGSGTGRKEMKTLGPGIFFQHIYIFLYLILFLRLIQLISIISIRLTVLFLVRNENIYGFFLFSGFIPQECVHILKSRLQSTECRLSMIQRSHMSKIPGQNQLIYRNHHQALLTQCSCLQLHC